MMKHLKKIIFFFLISTVGFSQEQLPEVGVITDSIAIENKNGSYSLYLPSDYNAEKTWPVILVFGPSGKGKLAVAPFVEAAEKYGYIVAGSNSLKNDTYQKNFNIARSFYDKVIKTYAVDTNKIYLAGFSGGARLAVAIATISKNIKGVIGCGASFANNDLYIPKRNSFLYVGLVGDEDFNYREMKTAMEYFDKLKFDAELLIFPGGHTWPPENYMIKAVRLLTLKSMTHNILPKNEERIQQFFNEDLDFNRELILKLEMLNAYNDIEEIKANYRPYFDMDTLKSREKEIRKNKLYKTQRNDQKEIDAAEPYYTFDYSTYLPKDIASGELESLAYWEDEIKKLKKEYLENAKPAKRKMGKRVLGYLEVFTDAIKDSYNEKEHADNLLYISIFETLVDPKAYDSYLEILKYTVKDGHYGIAYYYLEQMLENGFTDTKRLNEQEGITLLRIQPEYNEILESHGLKVLY
ncbi:alpha/beta hydrolase [Galbibacter sp. EGI 63066]|uniref:alpha/beta hydrolase n=1 Tax=Galbibacter sp. EGI 63066 TaxID=2993559 RepID=UPI002249433D|nr:alpha/beta hydrolase [Galbibacter sp. EGI 63066]MCX2681541.1 alpha/beta hydrolase [Galbibacter sp. EGI 63066]